MHFQIPADPNVGLFDVQQRLAGTNLVTRYVKIRDLSDGFASLDKTQLEDGDQRRCQIGRKTTETREHTFTRQDGTPVTEKKVVGLFVLMFAGYSWEDVLRKYDESRRIAVAQYRPPVQIPEGAVNCFLKG